LLPATDQGKVGVIYITTFSPDIDDETSSCIDAFIQEAGEGMAVSLPPEIVDPSSFLLSLILRFPFFFTRTSRNLESSESSSIPLMTEEGSSL